MDDLHTPQCRPDEPAPSVIVWTALRACDSLSCSSAQVRIDFAELMIGWRYTLHFTPRNCMMLCVGWWTFSSRVACLFAVKHLMHRSMLWSTSSSEQLTQRKRVGVSGYSPHASQEILLAESRPSARKNLCRKAVNSHSLVNDFSPHLVQGDATPQVEVVGMYLLDELSPFLRLLYVAHFP